ncbi:hypothetical protein CTI12_AA527300 [Artemisia annua]|uniref:Zinc knuckle CX2CX4HX4C n=1 Tax=Artemisia annua TaxID=35608 RepID=A0A2U1L567_ARTAN|nr:hypothetical protein CTI12_AA527300 [Artemisia annua]
MLDPDPAPHNMDRLPNNAKKNSSKGAVIAKGIDEMDVGNEACGNVEESVEGIGEDLGLHSKAQGDDQERNDGGNSVGKVAAEESGGVMYGNDGSKNAEMGDMESSPTMSKVPVGANANDSVRSTKSFANVLQGMAENNSNKLSRIASRIGTPIIMDKITSSMCEREFGRANFARVLVEVDAVKGLLGCVEVCYKSLGRSMSLDVEYAWTPPLCSHCKVFGHSFEACTKRELTEDEVAKMKEINDQHAQKASGEMKGNGEWRNVSYKKVVKTGAESSHVNGNQSVNRGTNFNRSNVSRGRGGFAGRGGYKNMQQGERSSPVESQKGPVMSNSSNEEVVDADEDVTMVDGLDMGGTNYAGMDVNSSSEAIIKKIGELEKEIVESNRCIGSTANKRAKEMLNSRMKKTGQPSNTALSGLYDEMYKEELRRIQGLTTSKQLLEVDLFFSLNTALTDDLKHEWNDDRNFRVFQKCARPMEVLFSLITDTVRLRLMGLKITRVSANVKEASMLWNFPLSVKYDASKVP